VLQQKDFERLLAFRSSLRRFQRWSQDQVRGARLTHAKHQLLVAVGGNPGGEPPTVTDLAGYLLLRHPAHLGELHSLGAVLDELVAGAQA
jgi:hypothetical protein